MYIEYNYQLIRRYTYPTSVTRLACFDTPQSYVTILHLSGFPPAVLDSSKMSRSRLPPTPSMSGEFIVKDQPAFEGTDVFALPPAAFDTTGANKRSSKTAAADHLPASPAASPEFMALGRSTNTRQQTSGTKRPLEDFDLPPPPTRTRKIIQMKPKTQPSPSTKSGQASSGKASRESNKAAPSSNTNANAAAPASGNKKKQPTATSAAGRKIARKTAHSLIERRRRSKMNEEFTTLKDMIPACTGQEMHKLAILQVSAFTGFTFDSETYSK